AAPGDREDPPHSPQLLQPVERLPTTQTFASRASNVNNVRRTYPIGRFSLSLARHTRAQTKSESLAANASVRVHQKFAITIQQRRALSRRRAHYQLITTFTEYRPPLLQAEAKSRRPSPAATRTGAPRAT